MSTTTVEPGAAGPKTNRIGLTVIDYKGGKTTLCAGCGHNAISERIIEAMYEMGVEPEFYVLRREGGDWVPWVAEDTANVPTRGYDLETTMLADACEPASAIAPRMPNVANEYFIESTNPSPPDRPAELTTGESSKITEGTIRTLRKMDERHVSMM